ncbi:MAG: AAA family ATPase [Rickettsiales bacterium]|nr:AAA family ATPase [Rickettsiales bacterium]
MILNGNQRGGAKDLALHLMKDENDVIEIHELRGFLSRDLMGALNEAYAISRGTRCKQFLYSLSLNPPKGETVSIANFEKAIEQAEERLGLQGQPRAVVFHEKAGKDGVVRRHCHVVWSRIDIERMKAVQMSHDREKLTDLSRELYLEHGWHMPRGIEKRGERDPTNYTYAEHQQAQRVGKNAAQIKADIQAAWESSDDRKSLEHAFEECGYFLAQGNRRSFVVVDLHGEVYSLPKQLPKGVNTKQVRQRLGDPNELPSVQDILDRLTLEHEGKPTYDAEKALTQVERYHSAFTPAMMERTLKPVIKDKLERHAAIQDILQSPNVIRIGEHKGKPVYTTQAMLELEQRMANNVQAMANTASHKADAHAVQRAIFNLNNKLAKETDGKASLSHEQKQALEHMANDKQLSLVVGVAGAGKTTIMEGAKEALESQGYRVRGAAPSGVAASGLREIGMNASTLHSLEYRIQLAQKMLDDNAGKPLTPKQAAFVKSAMLTSKDVLIVDEAGMVSAKQLANIIELTKQSGAKLVLVGDPAQLQSVEAGAAFRTLLERNDSASLTEVRRQQTGWQRQATIALSKGNVAEALQAYGKHGCIVQAKSRDTAKAKLVADVMGAQKASPDASRLVLAYTRKDVADLNAMIKAEMVKTGKVATENVTVSVTIKEADHERQEEQGFAMGDRILFRENNRDMGVMNGTFGTLKAVNDGIFKVTLDNGKAVSFSPQEYSHFQLGYAATVHKSQGMTVDQAFVLATTHFDRHTSYVALSRHKEAVKLYVNRKDFKNDTRLHLSLGRQGEKLSTLDFTDTRGRHSEAEPEQEARPSLFQRIKSFFVHRQDQEQQEPSKPEHQFSGRWIETPELNRKEERHTPTRSLDQQEFVKLQEEFMQRADMAEAQHSIEPTAQPDNSRKLER